MKRPSLVVLDVGHGNAAVLIDTIGVVVIDAGKGGVVLDFLREAGIKEVHVMLISHADTDHIRNAPDLLLDDDIRVNRICFNSDASKSTQLWDLFKIAIRNARRKKGLLAEPQLTTSQTGKLDNGEVHIEVLYPFPETAASGPGGATAEGETLTSNSMSAVIRLSTAKGKSPMVLLCGDAERGCLDAWTAEGADPTASVLVFPHHGGNPGADDAVRFATDLIKMVKPKTILFSIHRSQYELPIPSVIEAARRQNPNARVMCTQLSTHCCAVSPITSATHLNQYVARGRDTNSCCAGTIIVDLSGDEPSLLPADDQHLTFIGGLAGDPLCTKKI